MKVRADEVEIGDTIITADGPQRVGGWWWAAEPRRIVLVYGNRNHTHVVDDLLVVERENDHG